MKLATSEYENAITAEFLQSLTAYITHLPALISADSREAFEKMTQEMVKMTSTLVKFPVYPANADSESLKRKDHAKRLFAVLKTMRFPNPLADTHKSLPAQLNILELAALPKRTFSLAAIKNTNNGDNQILMFLLEQLTLALEENVNNNNNSDFDVDSVLRQTRTLVREFPNYHAQTVPLLAHLLQSAINSKDLSTISRILNSLQTSQDIDFQPFRECIKAATIKQDNEILQILFNHIIATQKDEVSLEQKLLPLHCMLDHKQDYAHIVEQHYSNLNMDLIDQNRNTPLHLAVIRKHKRSVGKLAPISNLNARNAANMTALELAVVLEKGNDAEPADIDNAFGMAKLLVEAGGDVHTCIKSANNKLLQEKLQNLSESITPKALAHPIEQKRTHKYRKLVFMGGGIKGLAYLSAIEEAVKQGLISLDELDELAGTSAGAISASLFAVNINFERIKTITKETKFLEFFDYVHPTIESFKADIEKLMKSQQGIGSIILALLSNMRTAWKCYNIFNEHSGICHGEKLHKWITARLGEGLVGTPLADLDPALLTFKDLADHPTHFRKLVVYGTNVDSGESEEYSVDTYPNGCVADAVRISVGIQVLFKLHKMWVVEFQADGSRKRVLPKTWALDKDKQLIFAEDHNLRGDGGLFYNYPIGAFDHTAKREYKYNNDVLGFYLVEDKEHSSFEFELKTLQSATQTDYGLFTLLQQILNVAMFNQQGSQHKKGPDKHRTVYIDSLDISFVDFGLAADKTEKLLEKGTEGVRNFIARIRNHPVKMLSAPVAEKMFKLSMLPGCEQTYCLATTDKSRNKFMTVARLLKLYACATEQEIAYLKTTQANPNFAQNEVTALQIAWAWGYNNIADRLIKCNANTAVTRLTQAEICSRIPEIRDDKLIMSGNEMLLMQPKKLRHRQELDFNKQFHQEATSGYQQNNAQLRKDFMTTIQQEQQDHQAVVMAKVAQIQDLEAQNRNLSALLEQRNANIVRLEERDVLLTSDNIKHSAKNNQMFLIHHYESALRADINGLKHYKAQYNAALTASRRIDKTKASNRANLHCLTWCADCSETIIEFFNCKLKSLESVSETEVKILTEPDVKAAYIDALCYLVEKLQSIEALIKDSGDGKQSYKSHVNEYKESIQHLIAKLLGPVPPVKRVSSEDEPDNLDTGKGMQIDLW